MDTNDTPLAERIGTEVLAPEDRRRLAVAETLMVLERDHSVTSYEAGQIVLRHASGDLEDIATLADTTNARLAQILARGY